jgi:hypothetical protein
MKESLNISAKKGTQRRQCLNRTKFKKRKVEIQWASQKNGSGMCHANRNDACIKAKRQQTAKTGCS